MLEILFAIFMLMIFGRLLVFGLRMAWGLGKIILTIVCLPILLVFTFFRISIYLAWPILLVVAIISLIKCK